MAPTPSQDSLGYGKMWDRATVLPAKHDAALLIARGIVADKARYLDIQSRTNVPWPLIGAWHMRESSRNFKTHLHCGDSLAHRTVHVPSGRPAAPPASGHLPYTFEESAVDALAMPPHNLRVVFKDPRNRTVERYLHETEGYNGWGYLGKGNSPYVWCWTSEYHGGKYIRDHVYSAEAWDPQPGCVAIFKALAEIDEDARTFFSRRDRGRAPEDAVDKATKRERDARNAGAGTAGAGTVAKTGTDAGDGTAGVVHYWGTYAAIGVGLAVMLLCVILINRKKNFIKLRWGNGSPDAEPVVTSVDPVVEVAAATPEPALAPAPAAALAPAPVAADGTG